MARRFVSFTTESDLVPRIYHLAFPPRPLPPPVLPKSMKVPGHKVGNWLDSETPLTSSTPTSHCLLSPAWWIPKCTPASFPHFHPLPSALNEALVIFYLEYGNPPLFCLPPSLSSFPSSVLTLIQAGPST